MIPHRIFISFSMAHSFSKLGVHGVYIYTYIYIYNLYIYICTNGMPIVYIYIYAGITRYNVMVHYFISTLATLTMCDDVFYYVVHAAHVYLCRIIAIMLFICVL